MKFKPTARQEKAFQEVIKAMDSAERTGLRFFGKCGNLVAYRKEAVKYFYSDNDPENSCSAWFSTIPYLRTAALCDSGADDYPCFMNEQDEIKYGE